MSGKVLVIGQKNDPHIDYVTRILHTKNTDVVFFNAHQPEEQYLNYDFSKKLFQVGDSKMINFQEITSVWWRVKPSLFFNKKGYTKKSLLIEFIFREWRSMIESLEFFLPKARWVNSRKADIYASYKPRQLLLAKKLGFHIPPTLISNNPKKILEFIKEQKDCVYKTISWYFEPPNKLTYTNKIQKEDIRKNIESIKISPGIFQKQIPKSKELRITVVGKKLFCVKIDSQSSSETSLDWRRNQKNIPYSIDTIPKKIEKRILDMNRELGLTFGAYDFIVTPDHQYYFLEVNPVGQWLWLEKALDLPISDCLAKILMKFKKT